MPKPHRAKPRTRAFVKHHLQMFDRHGLGLRGAMNIHELRQYIADLVFFEKFLRCLLIPSRNSVLCTAAFNDHRRQRTAKVRTKSRIAPDR